MNYAVDRFFPDEHDVAKIPAALACWYDAQSSIRRLWAVEEQGALVVIISLEPTSDGDDTLPVWLAKKHDWENDLRSLAHCDVQLRLIVSGVLEDSYVNDAVLFAELSWRDPWLFT